MRKTIYDRGYYYSSVCSECGIHYLVSKYATINPHCCKEADKVSYQTDKRGKIRYLKDRGWESTCKDIIWFKREVNVLGSSDNYHLLDDAYEIEYNLQVTKPLNTPKNDLAGEELFRKYIKPVKE